jgi:hypothetical protein
LSEQCDEATNAIGLRQSMRSGSEKAQANGELELRLDFSERAAGDTEKVAKLTRRISRRTFCDIRWN